MGIVWVIEKPVNSETSTAMSLMGDFPVRAVASISTLQKLLHMEEAVLPEILIVDLDHAEFEAKHAKQILDSYLPDVYKLFIGSNEEELKCVTTSCADLSTYFTKPINSFVVSKYIKKFLRGREIHLSRSQKRNLINYKEVLFDFENFSYRALSREIDTQLSQKEAQILKLLYENLGQAISRDYIKDVVWPDLSISERTIDSHISRLRKKLCDTDIAIDNVYGNGYIMR